MEKEIILAVPMAIEARITANVREPDIIFFLYLARDAFFFDPDHQYSPAIFQKNTYVSGLLSLLSLLFIKCGFNFRN